jgi:DNA polymerase-3 subunit epsilon
MTRQIILDTETTGLEPKEGHKIIEIGCVEMVNRRFTGNNFHEYLQPDREIEAEAIEVHGITNEFLKDKPRFEDVANRFMEYIKGAELIIHNAPFDIGFLNHELEQISSSWGTIADHCEVTDTLVMARNMFPGQKNNLDALCRRYYIDNSHRVLHGALLDSEILGDVYLMMTGGQVSLALGGATEGGLQSGQGSQIRRLSPNRKALKVIMANADELAAHQERVDAITKQAGQCLWN